MKKLREFAFVALVVGIVAVYYVYQQTKKDLLSSALDTIGERLVGLVDDTSTKDPIRAKFADVRVRILDQQVDPEEVEYLAANVLNLSASGTKLTPEEAEFILDFAFAPESGEHVFAGVPKGEFEFDRLPVPAKPAPPPHARELEELGADLTAIIETESELMALASRSETVAEAAPFMIFSAENGLHVFVDSLIMVDLKRKGVPEDFRRLEHDRRLVWRRDLMKKRQAVRDKARHDLERMSTKEKQLEHARSGQLTAIRALKELEAKGVYLAMSDSLQAVIAVEIEAAAKEIEQAVRIQIGESSVVIATENDPEQQQ
jgi:hypothetical protein